MLFASVVPQATSQPLRSSTTAADMTVLGTRFEVIADGTQTQLSVSQGRVELQRVTDDSAVEVPAGYRTVATLEATSPLQAMAIPKPERDTLFCVPLGKAECGASRSAGWGSPIPSSRKGQIAVGDRDRCWGNRC